MLRGSLFLLVAAAAGLGQATVPDGYRAVYISSDVNAKFVVVPKARTSGSTVVVKTLANTAEQQWYIKNGGDGTTTIQLANSTLCLDGGAKSNWKDMGSIYVNTCANGTDSQNWLLLGDGRIALEPTDKKECIDLQYMRATENNPVGLYNCAGLNNAGAGDKGINWPFVNVTASS